METQRNALVLKPFLACSERTSAFLPVVPSILCVSPPVAGMMITVVAVMTYMPGDGQISEGTFQHYTKIDTDS